MIFRIIGFYHFYQILLYKTFFALLAFCNVYYSMTLVFPGGNTMRNKKECRIALKKARILLVNVFDI